MIRSPRTSPSRRCTRRCVWCSPTPSICFSARSCVDRGRDALWPVPSRGTAIRPLPRRRRRSEPVWARHLLSGDAGDRGGAQAGPGACERDRLRPGLCGEPRLDVPVGRRHRAIASALWAGYAASFGLQVSILHLGVDLLGQRHEWVVLFGLGVTTVFFFLLQRLWVFPAAPAGRV